jgi:hypothetical protein
MRRIERMVHEGKKQDNECLLALALSLRLAYYPN